MNESNLLFNNIYVVTLALFLSSVFYPSLYHVIVYGRPMKNKSPKIKDVNNNKGQ